MADARNDLDSLAHTSRDLHAALRATRRWCSA